METQKVKLVNNRFVILIVILFVFSNYINGQSKAGLKDLIKATNRLKMHNNVWVLKSPSNYNWKGYLNFESLSDNMALPVKAGRADLSFPLDSLLTSFDLDYMYEQVIKSSKRKWTKSSLKGINAHLLKEKVKLPPFKNDKGVRVYYCISKPVYSVNKKIAMFYMEKHCGVDCGSGVIYVIKLEGSEWKVIASIQTWMS